MTMAENWLTFVPATEEYIKQHNIQSAEDPILAKYPHTSYVTFADGSRVVWNKDSQAWELVR